MDNQNELLFGENFGESGAIWIKTR